MKDGRFEDDDPVRCPICGWTGRFKEADSAPCPGGMTHKCPACKSRESRGRLIRTHEEDVESKQTSQQSLEEVSSAE